MGISRISGQEESDHILFWHPISRRYILCDYEQVYCIVGLIPSRFFILLLKSKVDSNQCIETSLVLVYKVLFDILRLQIPEFDNYKTAILVISNCNLLCYFILSRKPLYYLFNLVLPCVFITATTVLVFYLPPDSGEKVSLGVTVLLALTVFLLMVAEAMPPQSISIPLMGNRIQVLVFWSVDLVFSFPEKKNNKSDCTIDHIIYTRKQTTIISNCAQGQEVQIFSLLIVQTKQIKHTQILLRYNVGISFETLLSM